MRNEKNPEDDLTPYEIFQLERYGSVLNNCNPEDEDFDDSHEPRLYINEAFIFHLENPE